MTPELQRACAELEDPNLYVRLPERVIFDAHEEFDAQGKPVRHFDKAALEHICARTNARDSGGTFSPISIGHTAPGKSETSQPELVGVARHFKTRWDPDLKKWVIVADYYIRRDKLDEAKTYPRSSVELWPDGTLDPVALLRRTPARDLKSWTFALGGDGAALCYSRAGQPTALHYLRASADGQRRTVIRYSMESYMADETKIPPEKTPEPTPEVPAAAAPAPAPAAPAPDTGDTALHFMAACCNHPAMKRYMAEQAAQQPAPPAPTTDPTQPPTTEEPVPFDAAPAAPSGSNTFPPATEKDKEPERMQKDSDAIRYSRLEAEVQALREQAAQSARQAATADCERLVTQLEAEGFELDRVAEVTDMVGMTPEGRTAHVARVRRYYRQAPTGYRPSIVSNEIPGSGPKRFSREDTERALKMVETGAAPTYEAAVAQLKGAA